jgi:hypothetical protein
MQPALGERLEKALEEHAPQEIRGDKQAFQRTLRDRMGSEDSRQGTSYPAVHGYFSGKVVPSLPWLLAAARLLKVRPSWLAFGEGAPTEDEERRALLVKGLSTIAAAGPDPTSADGLRYWQHAVEVRDSVFCGWAAPPDATGDPEGQMPYWVPLLAATCQRLQVDPVTAGEALRAPLAALGINAFGLGRDDLDDYIVSMVPVLMSLAPQRARRTREEEDGEA